MVLMAEQPHHIQVDWFTRNVLNRAVKGLTRIGVSVLGSRELRVRGRRSGEWRTTPVNLLTVDGQQYLLAPRGTTQWVQNLRVAGGGELRIGRRIQAFTADELPDEDRLPVMREYLRRWWFEVGMFFPELTRTPSDEELTAVVGRCPTFRIVVAS
jgi:deazaflavin-dependent oxidoreductase (nitroreductase family)